MSVGSGLWPGAETDLSGTDRRPMPIAGSLFPANAAQPPPPTSRRRAVTGPSPAAMTRASISDSTSITVHM